jgi:hypothetical protein
MQNFSWQVWRKRLFGRNIGRRRIILKEVLKVGCGFSCFRIETVGELFWIR